MPYQLQPSDDGAIIRVIAEGRFDFESALPVFDDVRRELDIHPEAGILLDVRKVEYTPSASDVRHFVTRHIELTCARRNPQALVTAGGVNFGMAMMMSTLVEVSGGESKAFTSLEEAERWLLDVLHQRSSSPQS